MLPTVFAARTRRPPPIPLPVGQLYQKQSRLLLPRSCRPRLLDDGSLLFLGQIDVDPAIVVGDGELPLDLWQAIAVLVGLGGGEP